MPSWHLNLTLGILFGGPVLWQLLPNVHFLLSVKLLKGSGGIFVISLIRFWLEFCSLHLHMGRYAATSVGPLLGLGISMVQAS